MNFRICASIIFATLLTCSVGYSAEDGNLEPPPKIGFDKGFYVGSGDGLFLLKMSVLLQPRFTYVSDESKDTSSTGVIEATRDHTYFFAIARAQLILRGHVFSKSLTYVFQTEFAKGDARLFDAYVDFAWVPNWLHLRAGQWKIPTSRNWATSARKTSFVSWDLTKSKLGDARDIGLALHNNYSKSPEFEWFIGVFNGTTIKSNFSSTVVVDANTGEIDVNDGKFSNVPRSFEPMVVARAAYNYGGIKGYESPDLTGGDLRFSIGAGGAAKFDMDNNNATSTRAGIDYILKLHGFSTTGAFHLSTSSDKDFADQRLAAMSYYIEAGYVFAQRFHPVLRYSAWRPDGANNDVQNLSGAMSVFIFEHSFKFVVEYTAALSEEVDTDQLIDHTVLSQLQLCF